jgi:methionyl-tRNA formyltransferase
MSDRPGTVVFAYSEVGHRCLKTLMDLGADIRGVFTYEDDRNENTWFKSVRELALAGGVPVFTPAGLDDPSAVELVKSLKPEIVFSFYYRDMIPASILGIPRLGAFNMHGSLLPRYRGRACVNWAIINGETETGATLHWMTQRPDEGDIVDQERVPITENDTALEVMLKVADAAGRVLAESLPLIEAGRAPRIPQDHSKATYFGRRRPEDGLIDWCVPARDVCNLIRAVTRPYPGAFTFLDGRKVFIWKATPLDEKTGASPGRVVSREPLVIAAGKGAVRVEEKEEG